MGHRFLITGESSSFLGHKSEFSPNVILLVSCERSGPRSFSLTFSSSHRCEVRPSSAFGSLSPGLEVRGGG
jgi:hypothetical protein